MTDPIRSFGWRPETPDFRDRRFSAHFAVPEKLPTWASNKQFRPRIEDQHEQSSCVGHGVTSLIESLNLKEELPPVQLSRNFAYYQARKLQGWETIDEGCYIRDAIKSALKVGIPNESLWPYDSKNLFREPSAEVYQNAALRKGDRFGYYRLTGLNEVKAAIAGGYNVVFGFSVYESMMSQAVADSGRVPVPSKKESLLGGHCVWADGYDDGQGTLICINSWGTSWGRKGEFSLPYEFITNPDLSDDFWTVR